MDNSVQDVAQVVAQLNYRYIDQFLAALLPMGVTVILHGHGMGLASRCFKRFGTRRGNHGQKDKGPHIFSGIGFQLEPDIISLNERV